MPVIEYGILSYARQLGAAIYAPAPEIVESCTSRQSPYAQRLNAHLAVVGRRDNHLMFADGIMLATCSATEDSAFSP